MRNHDEAVAWLVDLQGALSVRGLLDEDVQARLRRLEKRYRARRMPVDRLPSAVQLIGTACEGEAPGAGRFVRQAAHTLAVTYGRV